MAAHRFRREDAPTYSIRRGCRWTAVPVEVIDVLPRLRGRAASVLLLAYAEAKPVDGGLWIYGSAREVAAELGYGQSVVKDAIAVLLREGVFVEHTAARNRQERGSLLFAREFWIYDLGDCG